MDYIVTRHQGSIDWAKTRLPDARTIDTIDPAQIQAGDRLFGVIPLDIAAEVCAVGARVFLLVFDRDGMARGGEVSREELDRRGARLVEYRVSVLGEWSGP